MKPILHTMLVVTMAVTACSPADPQASPPTGSSEQTLTVDGRERMYRVFRPKGLAEPAPLVLVLHGWGFSAQQAEQDYGWNALAAKHRFVVVYPEGVGASWNAGGDCCGPAADDDVDDVAFITELVDHLHDAEMVDPRRLFVAGFSNGGALAYTLACATDRFAAIGTVAASQVGDCERPRPTSVFHVHGTADTIVRFDGAPAVMPGALAVPSLVKTWRKINECTTPEVARRGTVKTSAADCADGREVTLVLVAEEAHTWPGHADSSSDWDATAAMWRMFSRQSTEP
ncbi:MAG TPA: PHB depolymerase family esterase [Aeromicrobium sp.]|nr:PHB depolymerase family esterase [Aeromicrobium sp.]